LNITEINLQVKSREYNSSKEWTSLLTDAGHQIVQIKKEFTKFGMSIKHKIINTSLLVLSMILIKTVVAIIVKYTIIRGDKNKAVTFREM
jgi:hypothetical protein